MFNNKIKQYYTYLEPVISDPLVKSYFSLVASLLLTAFLVVFALSPTINVLLGLRKQISDQQKTIVALDNKIAALITAQDSYNQAVTFIPVFNLALPENPAPQVVIGDIHKVASTPGVILITYQIQPVPISKDLPLADTEIGVPALKTSLAVLGAKEEIRRFLGDFERQLRYLRVDSFSIAPSEKGGGFAADILGMAYFFHE